MATIKSYTDINQSKVLAKILPLESADMRYGYIAPYDYSDRMYDGGYDEIPYPKDFLIKNPNFSANEYDAELPCWSLTALLNILNSIEGWYPGIDSQINGNMWQICMFSYETGSDISTAAINKELVDTCYEVILKLHERKML